MSSASVISRRALPVVLALTLLVTGVLAAAPPAAAADEIVTFDEGYVSDGARVTDEYRFVGNGGASGIRFGSASDMGWTTETECGASANGDYRPILRAVASSNGIISTYASSGRRVLESVQNNCSSGEFGTGAVLMRCTIQCLELTGDVGLGNETDTPPAVPDGFTIAATGYDAAGVLVASQTVPVISRGAQNEFTLTAPTGQAITFVKLKGAGGGNSVVLDTLAYRVDPAAVPAYSITSTSLFPDAVVRPGDVTQKTYTLQRSNGSSGTITPQVTGLPAGVVAAFSPAAFTGTDDGAFTMTLTAAANAAVGGPTPLTVSATAPGSAGSGTPTSLNLTVSTTLDALGGIPTLVAPSCTTQARELPVFVGDGSSFTGQVAVSATVNQPGWSAGVVTSPLQVTNGRVTPTVYWTKDGLLSPFTATLTVTASPVGRPNDAVTRQYQLTYQQAGFVAASVTTKPPLGDRQVGDALALQGYGFCAGTKLKFGNDKAVVDATTTQLPIALLPRNGALDTQTVAATTPRLATNGVLRFDRGDGYGFVQGPALKTTGFRNTTGFAFHNYPVNDLTYQDMTDAFGADQTYAHIDLCFPFGCTITYRDPIAMIYTAIVRSETVGTSGSGHCYGMSLAAAQLRDELLQATSYAPYTSATAYGLTGVAGPSPALDHTIQVDHLKQFGLTFLAYWLGQHAKNFFASGNDIVTQTRDAIDHQGGAMITIADQGGGHVVLAHSVEDVGPNDHWIDVYDPNWEYTAAEDSDATGAEHEKRLNGSRIHIVGDSWSLVFPDGTSWSGQVNGGIGSIIVVPVSEASKKQLLPSMFNIDQIISLLGSLVSFGSTGGGSTVTGGSGMLPYAPTNWTQSSGIFFPAPTGADPAPAADTSQTVQIHGTQADTVDGFVISDQTVVTSVMQLGQGTDVTVQKIRDGQAVATDQALPLTVTTLREAANRPMTTASFTAPAGGSFDVAQSATGFSFEGTRSVPVTLTIDSSALGSGGVTRTVSVQLAAHEPLLIADAALRGTGDTVAVTIAGKAQTLRATRVVAGQASVRALATKRSGARLTVVATAAVKAQAGNHGTVVLTLTRGTEVVATKAFEVGSRAARLGTSVTYRWTVTAGRGLTARASAAVQPDVGSAGLVWASRAMAAR